MNLNHDENSSNINATNQKTKFGTLYAVILIGLLVLMGIGQFFFPVSSLKSASDESKLKSAIENAHSVENKKDYKHKKYLGYSTALKISAIDGNDKLKSAIENASVTDKEHYEYSDYISYEAALNISENDSIKYTISSGNKIYPIELKNNKYQVSLSELAFKPIDYKIDISCKENHSPLIINAVLAISIICLLACAVFTVLGIITIPKNTNKACTTLTIAFIPMMLAKLSLFLSATQIKNFRIIEIKAENIAIIADPVHISLIPIIMLIVSICIPIISLKLIHRT